MIAVTFAEVVCTITIARTHSTHRGEAVCGFSRLLSWVRSPKVPDITLHSTHEKAG